MLLEMVRVHFFGKSYISGEYSRPHGVSKGGNGSGPLAMKDELNMVEYDSQEDEDHPKLSHGGHHHHHHHGHGLSHIGHDLGGHSSYDHHGHGLSPIGHDHGEQYSYEHNGHRLSHGGYHHGNHGYEAQQTPSHHYGGDDQYNDSDKASALEEDDDEDDGGPAMSIGLLSLFKYSTKWDIVLVILGCLGALINGGSLPWYSYLFGEFVNKVAQESSEGNLGQMIKDVEKVHNSFV